MRMNLIIYVVFTRVKIVECLLDNTSVVLCLEDEQINYKDLSVYTNIRQ